MRTILVSILLLTLLGGCSSGDQAATSTEDIQTRCLDGVVYYLFSETSGYKGFGYMAPKFRADGSLVACEG